MEDIKNYGYTLFRTIPKDAHSEGLQGLFSKFDAHSEGL